MPRPQSDRGAGTRIRFVVPIFLNFIRLRCPLCREWRKQVVTTSSRFYSFVSRLWPLPGFVPAIQAGSPSLPPSAPSALNAPADLAPPRLVIDVTSHYEFSDYSPAGQGGNVVETRVSLPLFIPLSKQWKLIGALGGGYTDYGTDPFGGNGMQTYKLGGLLTLNGQFTDVWSGSLNLRAEHDLNQDWSIFLRGEFDPGGAILAKRRDSEADSFNDEGFRAAAGLKWTPTRSFSLSMEGGVAFHEYTLLNDRSEILAEENLDPAIFVSISARLSF